MSFSHKSVLLDQSIESLCIKKDGIYLDGTFGRGGHSRAILNKLDHTGFLYAIDRDLSACEYAKENFKDDNFKIIHESFSHLKEICQQEGIVGKVDGILLDIGVSSPQIDDPNRGFSFDKSGPLDMRMDQSSAIDASLIVNTYKQEDIEYILREYGEERFAKKIARKIVEQRAIKPFETTKELADLIKKAIPGADIGKHKATRSFQGLRIAVNQELDELKKVLCDAIEVLADNGVLCVISFHSLEDRIVKNFFKQNSSLPNLSRNIPLTQEQIYQRFANNLKLYDLKGPIKATDSELNENIRARSAILRACKKRGTNA